MTREQAAIVLDVVQTLTDAVHWQHFISQFREVHTWTGEEVEAAFGVLADQAGIDNPMEASEFED